MNNLATRMKTFSGTALQQGIENLTPQVTHDHDTVLGEDIAHPNPVIVNEFYDIIDEEEEITSEDTAFNLLSDSTEALRRLEIIQMNVNYPVSGYRLSQATLMSADPGLESLIHHRTFSKSILNQGIESGKASIVIAAVTALISLLVAVAAAIMAIFRRRSNTQSEETVTDAEETIKKASTMMSMIQPPVATTDISFKQSVISESGALVAKSKPQVDPGEVRKMQLDLYTRDVYKDVIWPNIPHKVKIRVVEDNLKNGRIVFEIRKVSSSLRDYIDNLTRLVADVSDNIRTDGETVTAKISAFIRDNEETTSEFDELIDVIPKQDSAAKPPTLPDLDLFLLWCKVAAEEHAKVDYKKLDRAAKKITNLQSNLNKMVKQLNSARDLPPNAWVDVGKLNAIMAKVGTVMKLIAEESKVEATTSKVVRDMAKHIRKLSLNTGKD